MTGPMVYTILVYLALLLYLLVGEAILDVRSRRKR